ncbi:hypothetical protein ACF9IK_01450 [Kitasatospora hibisci]|uniref:hypothetical protein n=1 Tax=Kitasatospora hibisci TaxID=3369522 RepID=UPI00375402AF
MVAAEHAVAEDAVGGGFGGEAGRLRRRSSPDWVPPKAAAKVAAGSAVALLDAAPAVGAQAIRKGADGVEVREPAAGASKQAGELPVWLAPVAPEAGAKAADAPSADAPAPANPPVKVAVADAKAASAAGVQGALVSLARNEQADAAKARVGLDLSGVGFGGDFAQRARLVSLPACSLDHAGGGGLP